MRGTVDILPGEVDTSPFQKGTKPFLEKVSRGQTLTIFSCRLMIEVLIGGENYTQKLTLKILLPTLLFISMLARPRYVICHCHVARWVICSVMQNLLLGTGRSFDWRLTAYND